MNEQERALNPNEPKVAGSPSRGRVWAGAVGALVVLAVAAFAAYRMGWISFGPPETTAPGTATLYTCPMHPQVIRDAPGECPICHMELVPLRKDSAAAAPHDTARAGDHANHFQITPEGRIAARVATAEAAYRSIGRTIEVPANVDFNEATHRIVAARYAGRVEQLFVRETGQFVRKGDPLMDIYSPELLSAQKEYLVVRDARELHSMPVNTPDSAGEHSRALERNLRLVQAARTRLTLLGMTEDQIAMLERRGEVAYPTRVFSPAAGMVIRRGVTDGAYVNEGAMLLDLADLSSVWVLANVYETEAFRIKPGMTMMVSGPAMGGERRQGRIDYIYPIVDPASRTVRVRAVLANQGLLLKPGMYVTATIGIATKEALAVPVNAVVRTGARDLVYVEIAANTFEPREVTLGVKDGDYYEIRSGNLHAGDKVVAEGGFLIDSEHRLRGTINEHQGM